MKRILKITSIAILSINLSSCTNSKELKHYPVNDMNGVIGSNEAIIDLENSFDGQGALFIKSSEPKTVKLYETADIDIEKAVVTYQAQLKAKGLQGRAYLEIYCQFNDKGEFFSRSLKNTISGNSDWVEIQTKFFLKQGQNPDNIKLNLVIEGAGKVWIDDIHLTAQPLP